MANCFSSHIDNFYMAFAFPLWDIGMTNFRAMTVPCAVMFNYYDIQLDIIIIANQIKSNLNIKCSLCSMEYYVWCVLCVVVVVRCMNDRIDECELINGSLCTSNSNHARKKSVCVQATGIEFRFGWPRGARGHDKPRPSMSRHSTTKFACIQFIQICFWKVSRLHGIVQPSVTETIKQKQMNCCMAKDMSSNQSRRHQFYF